MKTLEEIKQWLEQNKPLLQKRYKVRELDVFGSYARQEQTEASDVDVLVEFSETPSLLRFVDLVSYLSDSLGVKIDLVHRSGLKQSSVLENEFWQRSFICDQATDS